jgi:hypothetical protein
MKKDAKLLEEAYMAVLREFEDDGAEEDSWWWEERQHLNNAKIAAPAETDYSVANQQHKDFLPKNVEIPFNVYEQCNKLILSCDSRRQLILHFCKIIDELTQDDKEAQQKVIELVDSVTE